MKSNILLEDLCNFSQGFGQEQKDKVYLGCRYRILCDTVLTDNSKIHRKLLVIWHPWAYDCVICSQA